MADEVEASGQPTASWDKELGPTFVCERIKIKHSVLEGLCVESDSISNRSKLGNSNAVRAD